MQILRFLTIMLVAASMGMALCHLLEMPVRLEYPVDLWVDVTVLQGTYRLFGPPVGATIEGAAWLGSAILAVFAWRRSDAVALTVAGAILMIAAHAAWWVWVFPANGQLAALSPDNLPSDFDSIRRQWEYTHAVRAVLQIAALGCLVAAAQRSKRNDSHVHTEVRT